MCLKWTAFARASLIEHQIGSGNSHATADSGVVLDAIDQCIQRLVITITRNDAENNTTVNVTTKDGKKLQTVNEKNATVPSNKLTFCPFAQVQKRTWKIHPIPLIMKYFVMAKILKQFNLKFANIGQCTKTHINQPTGNP